MKQLPANVEAVFFAGRKGACGEPDVIELDVADDYNHLPSKIRAFVRYALAHHDFAYLFKCDDDTYVVPERLFDLANGGTPFVGSSISAPHGFASGGAGYLLARAAAAVVAKGPVPADGAEDVWVSGLLRRRGFRLSPNPGLRTGYNQLPHPGNAIVTAHYCGSELMTIAQDLMYPSGDEAARTLALLEASHPCWEGELRLLSDGLFLGGVEAPNGHWEWDAAARTLLLHWFQWPKQCLHLREWGLEGPDLRLRFMHCSGPADWQIAMERGRPPKRNTAATARAPVFKTFHARHVDWSGRLLLLRDGTFRGGPACPDGRWKLEGDRITLAWHSWPAVVLQSDGAGCYFSTSRSQPLALHEDLGESDPAHLGGNIHGGDPLTFYPRLWKWIAARFRVRTVLDIGCGEGHALAEFAKGGAEVLGIDGLKHNVAETSFKGIPCLLHDFTKGDPALDSDFDLCWCCEFVEHVEEQFLANILAAFKRCRIVALTHAQPGQGGHHHVNCRPAEYWIGKMLSAGFTVLSRETAVARKFYPDTYWGHTGLIFSRQAEGGRMKLRALPGPRATISGTRLYE
jgi:SAM-dependent methyltransferase